MRETVSLMVFGCELDKLGIIEAKPRCRALQGNEMGNQHQIPRRGTKTLQTRVDVTSVHDGKGDATINFSQQATTQIDVHEKGKASYSEVHQEAVQKRQSDKIN